jgi:hypothetical protein
MAKKSRPTFQKREKERARVAKRKEKEARRVDNKNRRLDGSIGDDSDISNIVPGPQPLPEQWDYVSDKE